MTQHGAKEAYLGIVEVLAEVLKLLLGLHLALCCLPLASIDERDRSPKGPGELGCKLLPMHIDMHPDVWADKWGSGEVGGVHAQRQGMCFKRGWEGRGWSFFVWEEGGTPVTSSFSLSRQRKQYMSSPPSSPAVGSPSLPILSAVVSGTRQTRQWVFLDSVRI